MDKDILIGMAKAFFASAYADQAESAGHTLYGDIMDYLPKDIDNAAIHAAKTLYIQFEGNLGLKLSGGYVFLHGIEQMPDKFPETFGHCVAMQAMGHSVGIFEYCCSNLSDKVPHIEFGGYSLEKDYF